MSRTEQSDLNIFMNVSLILYWEGKGKVVPVL
jgi:hypothetical protein